MEKVTFMKEQVIKIPGFITSSGSGPDSGPDFQVKVPKNLKVSLLLLAAVRCDKALLSIY